MSLFVRNENMYWGTYSKCLNEALLMSTHNECFCGEMTKTCIHDSHFSGLVLISAYIYSIMSFALYLHVKSLFQALKLEISGLKKFVQTET